jgi:sialidase-1
MLFTVLFVLTSLWISQETIREEPPQTGLYAWYNETGIQADGRRITEWRNADSLDAARSLSQVVGKPIFVRVQTATGPKSMVRLQNAALWQTVQAWKSLDSERTIILYSKISTDSDGVLIDGSTRKGSTPVRYRQGKWETAARTSSSNPASDWSFQSFVFGKTETPLGGFIVGANVATQERLTCDIAEILVYSRSLTAEELELAQEYLENKWGQPQELPEAEQPPAAMFAKDPTISYKILRQAGDDGVHTYRIPGLATTAQGTLIAVFDARNQSGADLPGDIDVAMMRSTDNGDTWSPMKRIIDFDAAVPGSYGNGVGDPAVLVDHKTGTIFVAALWSKGQRAWHGSGRGLTPEETGQFVLVKSTDDGVTWSNPINITQQVKKPEWRLCFNGPGNGIQLEDSTLVFPAQFRDETGMPHSCFIASRDSGETWTISPPAIPQAIPTSESAIVQLPDGSLLLSMRNETKAGVRAWARWEWKEDVMRGEWSQPWYTVVDPTCMASLIRTEKGELLFSNPSDAQKRVNLTVRKSTDGGKTWDTGRVLDPGGAMYSCMTLLNDGRIGMLYESVESEGLVFLRFEP